VQKQPLFSPDDDPGHSFTSLLRKVHGPQPQLTVGEGGFTDTHATTICALRYAEGVIMVGDRRATAGPAIAQRDVQKVHPADRYSGVAVAGSAGFGMEMIKLLQTELEHYEKMGGRPLSMEGKANFLGQLVRQHLSLAIQFQGFIVVPVFAGYDLLRRTGRIFSYDPTGGRYEELDFTADGSGGRDARTTIKLGWQADLARDEAIELAVSALYEAADEDSATGGPDVVRGIYPTVATITEAGYEEVGEDMVAERFRALIDRLSQRGPIR
jgi:proteasome beta subunit